MEHHFIAMTEKAPRLEALEAGKAQTFLELYERYLYWSVLGRSGSDGFVYEQRNSVRASGKRHVMKFYQVNRCSMGIERFSQGDQRGRSTSG